MNAELTDIARQFSAGRDITGLAPLGNGLINDTYRVEGRSFRFVLQRINERVFPHPERIMENLCRIIDHLRLNATRTDRLIIPSLLPTGSSRYFHIDGQGHFWRAWEWVERSETRENIRRIAEAEQAGLALGYFHRLFSDLDSRILHDTLPGFHITPDYLRQYLQTESRPTPEGDPATLDYCRSFVESFGERAGILERARQDGVLRERIIHGDPKLNNFLFAEHSDRIVSLIDLDTVKPGLVHYDIGDCLRSCCHLHDGNRFDLTICSAILENYLREAGGFFDAADYDYLYTAIELIPFELGLRFFTDFLNGNRYFKVSTPQQNLLRAAAQFRLCKDIGRQRPAIEALIGRLRRR